jgi:hypothetical protein
MFWSEVCVPVAEEIRQLVSQDEDVKAGKISSVWNTHNCKGIFTSCVIPDRKNRSKSAFNSSFIVPVTKYP